MKPISSSVKRDNVCLPSEHVNLKRWVSSPHRKPFMHTDSWSPRALCRMPRFLIRLGGEDICALLGIIVKEAVRRKMCAPFAHACSFFCHDRTIIVTLCTLRPPCLFLIGFRLLPWWGSPWVQLWDGPCCLQHGPHSEIPRKFQGSGTPCHIRICVVKWSVTVHTFIKTAFLQIASRLQFSVGSTRH